MYLPRLLTFTLCLMLSNSIIKWPPTLYSALQVTTLHYILLFFSVQIPTMVASCMLSGSCLFILGLSLLSCVTHASPISAGKKLIHFGNILMFSMEKKFLILLLGWINIRLRVYILLKSSYVCNYDPIFWKYIFQQKTIE